MSTDKLLGNKNVSSSAKFEQFINLEADLNAKPLLGRINQSITGSIDVELFGKRELTVLLTGESFFVNLVGTIGERLRCKFTIASSTCILASSDNIRASDVMGDFVITDFWILKSGVWDDNSLWVDTAIWTDQE
jgi:hypothetical protein